MTRGTRVIGVTRVTKNTKVTRVTRVTRLTKTTKVSRVTRVTRVTGAPAGVPADGPQGEPVAGPGEEAHPHRGAHQEHLGILQGLLRQRGARPHWFRVKVGLI